MRLDENLCGLVRVMQAIAWAAEVEPGPEAALPNGSRSAEAQDSSDDNGIAEASMEQAAEDEEVIVPGGSLNHCHWHAPLPCGPLVFGS